MHGEAMPDNPRAVAGDNKPPVSAIESSDAVFATVSDFLRDNPVIEHEKCASDAKVLFDAIRSTLKSMEDERDGLVRPLNEQVSTINGTYRAPRTRLEKLLDEIKARLNAFIERERIERERVAEAARQAAAAAEEQAREAARLEEEAKANAAVGECTDVGDAVDYADRAFDSMARAQRDERRAERNTHVRIGGGGGRAISQRTRETLVIEDTLKAVKALIKLRGGLPEKLADALRTAARDYRAATGKLPDGITAKLEASI